MMAGMVRSFTTKQKPSIVFDIDGEKFTAIGTAPIGILIDVSMAEATTRLERMMALLAHVLEPDSHARFVARMRDVEHPIDGETFGLVIGMLVEAYGNSDGEEASDA